MPSTRGLTSSGNIVALSMSTIKLSGVVVEVVVVVVVGFVEAVVVVEVDVEEGAIVVVVVVVDEDITGATVVVVTVVVVLVVEEGLLITLSNSSLSTSIPKVGRFSSDFISSAVILYLRAASSAVYPNTPRIP